MAKTTILRLNVLNRLSEGGKNAGEWIDELSDSGNSNMQTIDKAFGDILKKGSCFRGEIIGDGVAKVFEIKHNRENRSPIVFIYDELGNRFEPNIKIISNGIIQIIFLYPIDLGMRLFVSIE